MSGSQMSGFDTSTQTGVGTITDVATSQTTTLQNVMGFTVSASNTTPGANGTRPTEPFWADRFVLLKHPQLGLWQLGGQPVVSMLAARGTPSNPDWFEPTVAELADCSNGGPLNPNGLAVPGTNDVLTSAECAGLLALDPLFVAGESFPGVSNNPRFLPAGGSDYGIAPVASGGVPSDLVYTLTSMLTNTNTTTSQAVGSYTATVTDVLTTSSTFGLTAGIYGITTGDSFTNTETLTNSTTWNVTLQTSFTATAQSSVAISGALDDHHTLPYSPHADFYRDAVFGSFLFQDKTAP